MCVKWKLFQTVELPFPERPQQRQEMYFNHKPNTIHVYLSIWADETSWSNITQQCSTYCGMVNHKSVLEFKQKCGMHL